MTLPSHPDHTGEDCSCDGEHEKKYNNTKEKVCWFRVYCPDQPTGDCLECPDIGQAQYNLVRQSDTECSFERVFGSDEWDDIITNITKEPDDACGSTTGPQSICLQSEYCLLGRVDSFVPGSGPGTGQFAAELGPTAPDENGEICFTVPSAEQNIYSFTVKCSQDDSPGCPPCSGVFPEAEFVGGEWVVEQDANYITVDGDQRDVTISAGDDLDCSLRLYIRGAGGECVTSVVVLCGESVTISSEVDLGTISPVPFTSAGCS